jgi:hypothetical protein
VKHVACVATAACMVAACGARTNLHPGEASTDWVLGTFSGLGYTEGDTGLSHSIHVSNLVFEPEGVGAQVSIGSCGESVREKPFTWNAVDGRTVSIPAPADQQLESASQADEWRIVRGDGCLDFDRHDIRRQEVIDGEVATSSVIVPAGICLAPYDDPSCPEDYQCNDCQVVWCDGPPEPCAD